MQLSDHDIRDINKYISEGKSLPDKYRFMLFEDKREVELVWNGKTNEVTNVVLPFQTVETIDEPRSDAAVQGALQQLSMFDPRGRQLAGWKNKLIWGDNKLILSSLKNGPLRQEIEDNGGIKLIYIDPPFDVGADFSMDIEVGEETFTKKPSVFEDIAYRDTWGKGADSWISMMYERLKLMRDLLAEEGTIYVHVDWRVTGYLRLILDEVFGEDNFRNEIIWCYTGPTPSPNDFRRKHDTIFRYVKTDKFIFNEQFKPYKGLHATKKISHSSGKVADPQKREELLERGKPVEDWWDNIYTTDRVRSEILGYPTQKPEALLERIIRASSNRDDIVCDFFCGSGTTLAVAEKLGRKWIGSDLGKFGIHTTRKRMIDVQREMKQEGKDYRAFEVLNIGKYERQYYVGINPTLEEMEKEKQEEKKSKEYVDLILSAYKADKTDGFKTFVGTKLSRLVAVGPVNVPVTSSFVSECIKEAKEKGVTKIDILGFEFEMNLAPRVQEQAKEEGIDLQLKYIPKDVFDKRAIDKDQVEFYDVAYIEATPRYKKKAVSIELTDFSVFYNQDKGREFEESMRNRSSKVIVDSGQIVKVDKDKDGRITKEVLTKKWSDWIDYWSVDFDYESKKEVLQVQKEDGEIETVWTGDYIFENEWQTFRTKQDRDLELKTNYHEYAEKGTYKVAIKVVDIFGNNTMKVIEIHI
jgi:site-specific DNA-methyltransferase (adenine-specific)/adenine-specific DNA-methyltransferase